MGNCKYCGQNAGLFRSMHPECRQRYDQALQRIQTLVQTAVSGRGKVDGDEIRTLAQRHRVPADKLQSDVMKTWSTALDRALEDGILSHEEENQLATAANILGINRDALENCGALVKIAMGRGLRELFEGKMPRQYPPLSSPLPFNMLKSEQPVWTFRSVKYFEQTTRREFEAGSQGVSFRIAKGVYYRVGRTRGRSVPVTSIQHTDTGLLTLTTKHIYFGGSTKSFRIPYAKIVSCEPYRDGISVVKEAANPKPQTFLTGNGWFVYNLFSHLASN